MSAFQKNATCPFCRKSSMVELRSSGALAGLQKVRCSHCRKSWEQDFSENDGNLQKSAPAASASSADLLKSLAAQLDDLTRIVTELVKKRMMETATAERTEKRFKPLATGEHLPAGADGLPVRKDIGPNAARRREDIVKGEGAVHHELQPQNKKCFVPGGVEKSAEALELVKAARANRIPAVPGLNA
ncbi:MAG: MJ0042-type zinc finger domain-containing protein [Candidatus Acidiferrales bacterium]